MHSPVLDGKGRRKLAKHDSIYNLTCSRENAIAAGQSWVFAEAAEAPSQSERGSRLAAHSPFRPFVTVEYRAKDEAFLASGVARCTPILHLSIKKEINDDLTVYTERTLQSGEAN
jgi:hypothetical protein